MKKINVLHLTETVILDAKDQQAIFEIFLSFFEAQREEAGHQPTAIYSSPSSAVMKDGSFAPLSIGDEIKFLVAKNEIRDSVPLHSYHVF